MKNAFRIVVLACKVIFIAKKSIAFCFLVELNILETHGNISRHHLKLTFEISISMVKFSGVLNCLHRPVECLFRVDKCGLIKPPNFSVQ